MKPLKTLLAGGIIIISHSPAFAETTTGLYLGGSIGQTELIDYELYESDEWQTLMNNIKSTAGNSSVTSASISDPIDENSETGVSIFAGIRIAQFIGVEGALSYHGSAKSELSSTSTYTTTEGQFTESLTAEAETLTYSFKGSLNLYWELNPGIELYSKLGAHYWYRSYEEEVQYKLDAPDSANSLLIRTEPNYNEKGFSPFIGIGFQWQLAPDISVRLETEYLPIDSDKRTDWDIQSYSLGVVYRFGAKGRGSFSNNDETISDKVTACDKKYEELFKFCK